MDKRSCPLFKSSFHRLCLILGLAGLAIFSAAFSRPGDKTNRPAIDDADVPRYLERTDLLRWERAQRDYRDARSLIESGEWLTQRESTRLTSPEDVQRARKQGQAQVERGQERLQAAENILRDLRSQAARIRQDAEQEPEEVAYTLMEEPLQLEEALDETLRPVLFALWEKNYTRIYFGGAYLLMDPYGIPHYKRMPDFEKQLRSQMQRVDGNRFTTVTNEDLSFSIDSRRNRQIISFPGREQVLRNFKSALMVAEVLYDERLERAFLSVRGINMETMETVAAELASVIVDDPLRNLYHHLETDSEDADERSPLAGMPAAAKELHANLRDRRDFINRISDSPTPFIFRYEFLGEQEGFEARFTSIISKSMLVPHGFTMNESDFIIRAFPAGEDFDETASDGSNAAWRLTPLDAGRSERVNFDVEAVSQVFDHEQSLPVGLLQVVTQAP